MGRNLGPEILLKKERLVQNQKLTFRESRPLGQMDVRPSSFVPLARTEVGGPIQSLSVSFSDGLVGWLRSRHVVGVAVGLELPVPPIFEDGGGERSQWRTSFDRPCVSE